MRCERWRGLRPSGGKYLRLPHHGNKATPTTSTKTCGSPLYGGNLTPVRSPGDRRQANNACGRKVRAPQGRVVGNAHRSRDQGKCHRNNTAGRPDHLATVRVKW